MLLHCRGCFKMKKSWKKRVSGCNSVAVKTENSPELWNYPTLPFWKSKAFTPTPTFLWESIIVADTTAVSQNGIWHVYFFFILKYLCNPLLYIPSICSNLICFKVQMTLSFQLGLDNQWKVYSNLRIWIILINLCHFKHKTGFLRLL